MARRVLPVAMTTLVALCTTAPSAAALESPELLYREGVSENEPLGPWLPLEGAHIDGLGFIVGTRQQAKAAQDNAVLYRLSALAVPDGHPDQGAAFDPAQLCISSARAPGTELVLGSGRFEGPGSYSIKLNVDLTSNGATSSSCSGGPSSTATFTIDPVVAIQLLATKPVLVPVNSLARVTTMAVPTGGQGETQCARDATLQADGSIAGADRTGLLGFELAVRQIPRSGRWTCVGRARGAATAPIDGEHYTHWGPPVAFDAVSDFSARFTLRDRTPKRYTVAYSRMPPGAEGGVLTLRIRPGKGCPRVPTKIVRARVGTDLTARFSFTLPEKRRAAIGRSGIDSYGWSYRVEFGGTRLVRAGRVTGTAFVSAPRFGHRLSWGKEVPAYCTRTT